MPAFPKDPKPQHINLDFPGTGFYALLDIYREPYEITGGDTVCLLSVSRYASASDNYGNPVFIGSIVLRQMSGIPPN